MGAQLVVYCQVHGPVPLDKERNPKLGVRKWPLKHEAKVVSEAIGDGDDLAEGFSGYEYEVRWDITDYAV